MNVFEKIKSMNIDEFTEWFSKNHIDAIDQSMEWWNNTYCSKCESEIVYVPDDTSENTWRTECEVAWCEVNDNCKYFQDLDDAPDYKQIVRLWLESEWKDE